MIAENFFASSTGWLMHLAGNVGVCHPFGQRTNTYYVHCSRVDAYEPIHGMSGGTH